MSIYSLETKVKKELWKRKKFLKLELKKLILQSVIHNNHISYDLRAYSLFKRNFISKRRTTLSQHNGVCLTSGKLNTSRQKLPFSRQFIKKYCDLGLLQNIKSISW